MISSILKSVLGTSNQRFIKSLQKTVDKINSYSDDYKNLKDNEIKNKTQEFKKRFKDGQSLDDILPEAFALVREASVRAIGLRHYDVQLVGGIILHQGKIAEMQTGEGKTLVATLPVYLNCLTGDSVHLVTVNEYLAKRDAEWMGKIYELLGLTTGIIIPNMTDEDKKQAYSCDVVYGTNNEFGFDFLRDNLKLSLDEMVQKKHSFAIVDEVDSILIDEARTPLIISGPSEDSSELYKVVNNIVCNFDKKYIDIDEKSKNATLTEDGMSEMEKLISSASLMQEGSLYDNQNIHILHHINQSIKAHFVYVCEKDYIVEDGQIIIIDEFSGRKMQGRRYGEGLHQAIEAKEGVKIASENQTLASITFQNYFRMYEKLSGMTGTALTEANEFEEIYHLKCVAVPTNVPVKRIDNEDDVYRTSNERDEAVIAQVIKCQEKGQPVLLGTASIDKSEHFSKLMKKAKIKHNVLNAKNHEKEAEIILNAGLKGAVTIATNMAGRGTDIKLGGIDATDKQRKSVLDCGGLYVLGTERHESRRIDNQLRGRSGRQGDFGETKFFLSLEDDLMRIFGSSRLDKLLQKMGIEQGEAITHPWVSKALAKAQHKVEGYNFEIRKQLIKYDDVTNEQRRAMFSLRKGYMTSTEIFNDFDEIRYNVLEDLVSSCIPEKSLPNQWDIERLKYESFRLFAVNIDDNFINSDGVDAQAIFTNIKNQSDEIITKIRKYDNDSVAQITSSIMIQILDNCWKEHLLQMDYLRQGIGLRAYGQKDPLNEYKNESYTLYETFLNHSYSMMAQYISHLEIEDNTQQQLPSQGAKASGNIPEVGRNKPCPCGSQKKYKHCCGKR